MIIPNENSFKNRTPKQKVISDKITNFLLNNKNRLIDRKELVCEVYGNAANLSSKKRSIDVFICKDVKPKLEQMGYQIEVKRRVGIKITSL